MDIETTTTTTTSGPVSGLVSTIPSGLPVNKVAIITQPQNTNASLEASIHAHPLPASTVSLTNDKGKSVAFDVPVCQPSPDGNAAAIKSSPSRFHAAAYLHDTPAAFKEKFTSNRTMCDEVNRALSRYSSYEARRSDQEKSLFVTDIPLFLNETQIRQAFSRYGIVVKYIWAIICLGNSLRVCPASYLKSQRDSCREHVAILACISKNIKEADLLEIASQVNAKAINIPLSYNSYKPKPYAYFNFASFENLEAAKDLTIAFRVKGLSWHSPNEARELCHVCGRHGCSLLNAASGLLRKQMTVLTSFIQDSMRVQSVAVLTLGKQDLPLDRAQSGPSSFATNGPANSSRQQPTRSQNKDKAKDVNQQDSSSNPGPTLPSSSRNISSIPPDSPDASFSTFDPKSVLSRRHAHLPVRMDLGNSSDGTHIRQEILSVSTTHKEITNQLGSILVKLDSLSSSDSPALSK
ncbi:hypothetical protein RhiirA4_483113 [Rhizophagus irregularis]|uniref:RRM domain-containing protein n=1 Tax=Rhizophagus irregularis TaxID=588596 RepID=A0A2I1HM57_9GLOM|nr:hypothetical protein RhiirA4_483113 [Rhizophagus irregularis]